ncbi:MAG: hypothetical protein DWQ36_11185 [Acidobacteria bacterium]|nr:MAG: hypothetical protein DWQ30_12215 [Acidobacteriota bacterium]REK07773.1 MAG: hypothetical protein DWQ36_11185 [Acidobacteriota bacterium]
MVEEPRDRAHRGRRRLLLAAFLVVATPAVTALLGTKLVAPWKPLDERTATALPAALAQAVNAARELQRFNLPPALTDLRPEPTDSNAVEPSAISAIEPVSLPHDLSPSLTAVREQTPVLRWSRGLDPIGDSGALDELPQLFEVLVSDPVSGRQLASSGPLTESSWRPRAPLERGRVLSWRVLQSGSGEAPDSGDARLSPEARLRVLTETEIAELERRLGRLPPVDDARNQLARAVVLVEAGLLDEARQQLRRADALEPQLRQSLLESLPR